jgi:cytoskeletal protein CcmA (bactofilin family)
MNHPKRPPPINPNPPKPSVDESKAAPVVEEKRTLVEEGTRFKGTLTSQCPIVVHGSIEGDVNGAAISVSATGSIAGKVTAGAFKSEGKIAGTFEVDTAELAGTVGKNTVIRATSLSLKLAAPDGKVQLAFGGGRRS